MFDKFNTTITVHCEVFGVVKNITDQIETLPVPVEHKTTYLGGKLDICSVIKNKPSFK